MNLADKKRGRSLPTLTYRGLAGFELSLHCIKERLQYDRLMLAGIAAPSVIEIADINPISQNVQQRRTLEDNAADDLPRRELSLSGFDASLP